MQTASLSKIRCIGRAVLCLCILIALTTASARMPAAKAVLDFDGDGKCDFAVYGVWYWIESSTGALHSLHYGIGGRDFPAPGDYDGDGKTDQAVTRHELAPEFPAARYIFYVNQSTGGMTATHWGNGYDYSAGGLFAR